MSTMSFSQMITGTGPSAATTTDVTSPTKSTTTRSGPLQNPKPSRKRAVSSSLVKLTRFFQKWSNSRRSATKKTPFDDTTSSSRTTVTAQQSSFRSSSSSEASTITLPFTSSTCSTSFASSTSSPHSALAQQLFQIEYDAENTNIVLYNFVLDATREDLFRLRDLLDEDSRPWRSICFLEHTTMPGLRRFHFKKEWVYRHLQAVVHSKHIHVEFKCRLDICFQDFTAEHLVSVLEDEVSGDAEITKLYMTGTLDLKKAQQVLPTLMRLLCFDDRSWRAVALRISYDADGDDEASLEANYQRWQDVVQRYKRILTELAMEQRIPIGVAVS